jgi:hypothetical protein
MRTGLLVTTLLLSTSVSFVSAASIANAGALTVRAEVVRELATGSLKLGGEAKVGTEDALLAAGAGLCAAAAALGKSCKPDRVAPEPLHQASPPAEGGKDR